MSKHVIKKNDLSAFLKNAYKNGWPAGLTEGPTHGLGHRADPEWIIVTMPGNHDGDDWAFPAYQEYPDVFEENSVDPRDLNDDEYDDIIADGRF